MKITITLLLGFLCGAALVAIGLIYNPFVAGREMSGLSVGDQTVTSLGYTAVPTKSIAFTNGGDARMQPHPEGIGRLLEDTVKQTNVLITEIHDARGQIAGLGVKFSSRSERTSLWRGEALVDSVWFVQLPGSGSFFIEQAENYWQFIREVMVPAYRNAGNSWKGRWSGDLTAGPGGNGVARVTGVGGPLLGRSMAAVESLSVQAYSMDKGPVSAEGRLLIEISSAETPSNEDAATN